MRNLKKRIYGAFLLSVALFAVGHAFPALALAATPEDGIHQDLIPHPQAVDHLSCATYVDEILTPQRTSDLDTVNFCVGSNFFLYDSNALYDTYERFLPAEKKPPLPHPLESKTILRL